MVSERKFLKVMTVMLSLIGALLITLSVGTTAAYGQVVGATLSGTVKDPSGAVIPGAKVLIENTATGVKTTVTTNSAGVYAAPDLLPGNYVATATASGFQTSVLSNLTLVVGGHVTANFTMQIGKTTQTVHVSGAVASAIQLSSPSVSAVVSQHTITTLPLNGRDWTQLATLQPGVSVVHSQGTAASPLTPRGNRGYGTQLSDSGHSPYENNYRVDGIMINDYSNGGPGSVSGVNLGVDAIQEFSVETSTYGAKYGMSSGAIINSITKSGTNQFHGGAYGFLRDEGLDAKNYFDAAPKIPPFHRNIFGVDAGGPIVKNKMFVFGDWEGVRQSQALTYSDTVPSLAAQNGFITGTGPVDSNGNPTTLPVLTNLTQCPNGGAGYTIIDPGVSNTCALTDRLPYLAMWPHAGQSGLPGVFGAISSDGNTQAYNVATGAPYSENFYTARFDANITSSDKFTGSFFYDKSPATIPDALSYNTIQNNSIREMYELAETHIFSSGLVNTARFGFARNAGYVGNPGVALNPVAADTSLGVLPGLHGPLFDIPGLTFTSALGSAARNDFYFNTFQFYDDVFLVHGNHSMQFGFSSVREQYNHLIQFSHNGKVYFASFSGLLNQAPTEIFIQAPIAVPKVHLRTTAFGAYFTDSWHVRSNLTATLGVRWEPTTLPTNAGIPFQRLTSLTSSAVPETSPTLWTHNASLHDFQPRIGLAWDPFGTGKTSVRAGFGIYDMLPMPWVYAFSEVASKAPFFYVVNTTQATINDFPNVPLSLLSVKSAAYPMIQQNPKVAYSETWSLTVQRSLTPSMTATIGYVGSHSVHFPTTPDDANWSLPTYSSTAGGYVWPCSPVAGACTNTGGSVLNSNVGAISPLLWTTSAKYNALQLGLTKSMSHGVEFQGSYTWGKCLDTNSGYGIPDQFTNSITALGGDFMYFNPNLTKGLCDYSVDQNLTLSGIWAIPTGHLSKGLNYFIGGWQVGGIVTAQSGVPFSVLMAGDPLRRNAGDPNSDQPDRIPGCNLTTGNINAYINLACYHVPSAPAAAASICNQTTFTNLAGIPSGQIPCANLFGNAGRNNLIGPKLVNVDFSIYKNVPITAISEAFNVQFRASFFNIFNHPNFLPPLDNGIIMNANGVAASGAGRIDSTSTTNRQVQLGLRITW